MCESEKRTEEMMARPECMCNSRTSSVVKDLGPVRRVIRMGISTINEEQEHVEPPTTEKHN